jgi:hypothetical protein
MENNISSVQRRINKNAPSNFNNCLRNTNEIPYFVLCRLAAVIILIEYNPPNDVQLLMHQSEELI